MHTLIFLDKNRLLKKKKINYLSKTFCSVYEFIQLKTLHMLKLNNH